MDMTNEELCPEDNSQNLGQFFTQMQIEESIQDGIQAAGFVQTTPIQAKTLALTLAGYDVMGIAQTGTGKTAAFLISLLNYLMVNPVHPKAKGPWAIVLAPTRELAIQIKKDLNQLGKYTGLNSLAVYGGTSIENQKNLFMAANIDIIIGTPGRIIDLYKQKVFRLKNIEVCVLDEADRMFDLGFIDDVRYLLKQMPPADERLNLLFSATMSERVKELAYEHFNAPKFVSIESETPTADNISESLYHTAKHEKTPLLLGLLRQDPPEKCIIFLNTKRDLERLSAVLNANDCPNLALYGDIAQKKREQIIKSFQTGKSNILLATDVAARGIHIPNVSHVFNYDLPQTAEDYVHRIGRTARAGASGKAISFADEEYVYSLPEIEHYISRKIPALPLDESLLADLIPLSEAELAEFDNQKRANNRKTPEINGNSEQGNYNNPPFYGENEPNNPNNGNFENKRGSKRSPNNKNRFARASQNENFNSLDFNPFPPSGFDNSYGNSYPAPAPSDGFFSTPSEANFNSPNSKGQNFYSFGNSEQQNYEQHGFGNTPHPQMPDVSFNHWGNQGFEEQYLAPQFGNSFANSFPPHAPAPSHHNYHPRAKNRLYQNQNNRRKPVKFRRIIRKNTGNF